MATISSFSVGMSKSVVSASGYEKVSLRISANGLVWAATTSRYDAFGGLKGTSDKWSVEMGRYLRLAGAVLGPFIFSFIDVVPGLSPGCDGDRSALMQQLICDHFVDRVNGFRPR